MSYILDALQKSSTEGNSVVTTNLLRSEPQHRKHRLIGSLIIVALLANAAVFAWLFWPERVALQQTTQPTTATVQASQTTVKKEVSSQSTLQNLADPTDLPEPPPATVLVKNPVTPPLDGSFESQKTITLGDLPAPARSAFPDIEFSTHIYAEDHTLRAIVANGQRLKQGDSIDGLKLIEITPEGVIFRYQEYLITISVLALWEDSL